MKMKHSRFTRIQFTVRMRGTRRERIPLCNADDEITRRRVASMKATRDICNCTEQGLRGWLSRTPSGRGADEQRDGRRGVDRTAESCCRVRLWLQPHDKRPTKAETDRARAGAHLAGRMRATRDRSTGVDWLMRQPAPPVAAALRGGGCGGGGGGGGSRRLSTATPTMTLGGRRRHRRRRRRRFKYSQKFSGRDRTLRSSLSALRIARLRL